MKKTLSIVIESGEKTCASSVGEFCRFIGSIKFGQIPVCILFPSGKDSFTVLDTKDGWTQRCKDCIESEE